MASPSSKLGVCNLATPLISGTVKATFFKFGGYFYRANRNKSPLKILEKTERGRIQRLPFFWGVPPIYRERTKLRTSNLAGTFRETIQIKAYYKFWRKGSVGISSAQIFWVPLLSQERIKLRNSNFVGTFIGSIWTKIHENVGNSSRGRSQGFPKIFKAPLYRAHCAVIFAIAQLSCFFTLSPVSNFKIRQTVWRLRPRVPKVSCFNASHDRRPYSSVTHYRTALPWYVIHCDLPFLDANE